MKRPDFLSYQDLLDQESRPVPESLRESTETYLGSDDRYQWTAILVA